MIKRLILISVLAMCLTGVTGRLAWGRILINGGSLGRSDCVVTFQGKGGSGGDLIAFSSLSITNAILVQLNNGGNLSGTEKEGGFKTLSSPSAFNALPFAKKGQFEFESTFICTLEGAIVFFGGTVEEAHAAWLLYLGLSQEDLQNINALLFNIAIFRAIIGAQVGRDCSGDTFDTCRDVGNASFVCTPEEGSNPIVDEHPTYVCE